jgi:chloramphenicol-sensitive protein RarD
MISKIRSLDSEGKGVVFAVIAHLFWGAMAGYMGLIRYINPLEIAVHRALWSVPIGLVVAWRLGLLRKVAEALRSPRTLLIMACTSFLMVFNWTIYIWCISQGRTLDASLGYFINPLMNVAVGFLFLGERFTKAQLLAIGLAVVAVAVETLGTGMFPTIGLSLAATFCLYGLVRKTIALGAIEGFLLEVGIAVVPLLAVDYWLGQRGELHFGTSAFSTLMLMGCGVFTAGALMFYSASIKLIRYSTAGLLQYLSPTLVFLTAVFIFGEPIDKWKLSAFAIIWLALAIYSISSLLEEKIQTSKIVLDSIR